MFKKVAAALLALTLVCSLAVLFTGCGADSNFKVGVILVGDETEGYSLAHINGIKDAGISDWLAEPIRYDIK